MKKVTLFLLFTLLGIIILSAQIHRDPPLYNISVNPTEIMFSAYDYMIGGYNASPVIQVPTQFGGGYLMAFHATNHLYSQVIRYCYLAYINNQGLLQSIDSVLVAGAYNGYPSLAFDESSGIGFLAWHNKIGNDTYNSVYGALITFNNGEFEGIGTTMPIFSSHLTGANLYNPVVKFGPSPFTGMRRLYVMAKKSITGTYPLEVPQIAYIDFNPDAVRNNDERFWHYLTVPELEAWALATDIYRRTYYTIAVDDNGSIYLLGYHTALNINPEFEISEPNIDVFICDNYCNSPWYRISMTANQVLSCQLPNSTDIAYVDVSSSGHFNAVVGDDDIIRFPQLYTYKTADAGNIYSLSALHSLRNIEFDINYENSPDAIKINDLYPQGASPHSAPAYTPWDLNEDGIVDSLDGTGNAVYQTTWPFLYYDWSAHNNSMMFQYNLQLMTEPNDVGWMACVWQDSNKARLYRQYPDVYPQYADYNNVPEIYISLSYDFGENWLEPIVLNSVTTPQLNGMLPVWVYPANKFRMISSSGTNATGRLYMMFYDDNVWGSFFVQSPPSPNSGGHVNYLAIDVTMPFTDITDPVNIPSVISLEQNYPNPFNKSTSIKYSLARDSNVKLDIYNVKGQLVKTLAQGKAKAGENTLTWNGEDSNGKKVSTGLYFYKLQSAGKTLTRKLLLIK